MSGINFDGCNYIDDVVRRHAEQLPGKVLVRCFEQRTANNVNWSVLRTPILGIESGDKLAVFGTEDMQYKRVNLAFPLGLAVVTSIYESGDIWWPNGNNDWSRYYGIDDLNADDIDVDSVLRFAEQLPKDDLLTLQT
jgi:hypothetical protein